MKNKNSIIFIFLIIFFNVIVHCESFNNNIIIEIDDFYKIARSKLKEEKFNDAIFILEKIKNKNGYQMIHDKIQMNLIYAYYKKNNFSEAQKNIQNFIRFYPNHPNIDYIVYMQCLIQIAMDKHTFLNIPFFNYYKNDPHYAINAFFQLKKFIYQYPKSLYLINAKKNLIYLKYRLSEHDLKILEYYYVNQEYRAAINRGEEIIQKYSETPSARKTLIYMKKSYIKLKMFHAAQKISKIIALNNI